MTTHELRDYFNTTFGLEKWPDTFEVDSDTYANVCQDVFNITVKIENLTTAYRGGNLIEIAIGHHNGIYCKNVELILRKNK